MTVAYVGEPAPRSFPGRPVGEAEYGADPKQKRTLRVQRSRPCPLLARNGVLQHLKDGFAGSDQLFVPHPSGERHHQPGCRIYYFGLPQLLALTPSEAPAFIGLQAGAGQPLDPLVVELLSMLPKADCQPLDRFWGDACESGGTPDGGTFSKLQGRIRWIGDSTGLALTDLAIPDPKSPL